MTTAIQGGGAVPFECSEPAVPQPPNQSNSFWGPVRRPIAQTWAI